MSLIPIALLVCDTPIPPVLAFAGDYHTIYTTFLCDAAKSCGDPTFVLDPYDVVDRKEYPPEDAHYEAIIITGSKFSAYEDVDWINKLVAYVASIAVSKPSTKIIGICFGHQIVGRALGGECVPNDGKWEVGVTQVHLSDIGQRLLGVPVLNIQQMHRDHVPVVPPGFLSLGSTPVSPVQGLVKFMPSHDTSSDPSGTDDVSLTNVQILTVQGHPEFTRQISETYISARLSTGILDSATAEDGRRRAHWRNDGVDVIGKTIFRMFGVTT